MTDTLVSIIIPIYRVHDYLRECLDSLVKQDCTFKYNILLIETGSDDGSDEICKEYQEKYLDRIYWYHYEQKEGISFARDLGILHANGKYVSFIDGDDTVSPDFLSTLYHVIEENPNTMIVSGNYCYDFPNKKVKHKGISYQANGRKAMNLLFRSSSMNGYCWGKLFSRKFLLMNHIFFDTDVGMYEDLIFMSLCYLEATKVISIKNPIYFYRQHDNSTMSGAKDILTPHLEALAYIKKAFHQRNRDAERIMFASVPSGLKSQMKYDSLKSAEFFKMKKGKLYKRAVSQLKQVFETEYE